VVLIKNVDSCFVKMILSKRWLRTPCAQRLSCWLHRCRGAMRAPMRMRRKLSHGRGQFTTRTHRGRADRYCASQRSDRRC
jgi:hypothetical protein